MPSYSVAKCTKEVGSTLSACFNTRALAKVPLRILHPVEMPKHDHRELSAHRLIRNRQRHAVGDGKHKIARHVHACIVDQAFRHSHAIHLTKIPPPGAAHPARTTSNLEARLVGQTVGFPPLPKLLPIRSTGFVEIRIRPWF